MSDTALEKAKTPAVITTADEYRASLRKWQEANYNILTPFATFSGMNADYGLVATLVHISPDPTKEEVYVGGRRDEGGSGVPWLKKGEYAIAKVGLRKIAEAGAISTSTMRTDPRTERFFWEMKAVAKWRTLDGTIRTAEATFEWDMRDGSPRTKGFTSNQIDMARANGLRHCESRAVNAAIREYGVRQKYTLDDLKKPFVVIRAMYIPDTSDPAIKRLVAEANLRGIETLYPAHASALPPVDEAIDVTPADAQATNRKAAIEGAAAPSSDEATLPKGFGYIQKVETKELKRRDGKGTFLKWCVVDHAGVEHVTIKKELGDSLERCWKDHIAVDIASDENTYQELEISEFLKHDSRQGCLLPDPDKL